VTTTGDEYFADTVIVATPANILRIQAVISLSPLVPSWKQCAWGAVQLTDGMKLWPEFLSALSRFIFAMSALFTFSEKIACILMHCLARMT
jgi:hypothetical protein